MPKTTCTALAVTFLAGGLIAGCGSSSKTTASAGHGSGNASPNPYSHSSGGSSTGGSSSQKVALITTKKHGKLGAILAYGSKKLTVYLFEADRNGKSACSGNCAQVWPPVIGMPKAGAGAMSADLGTITRSDGSKQLTYKGHPLYTFAKDRDDGDAYGQGLHSFGADWYTLSPSGSKVDQS